MNWPVKMLEEFKEFNKSKECTRAHNLIELLFETKMPPCYYTGDLTKARFGLLGLNPGYGKGRIKELTALEEYGWEKFYSNFFEIFHHKLKLSSNYYTQFSVLLSGVLNKSPDLSKGERYTLLQENLVNFDLIPYHSKRFNVKFIEEKQHLIEPYLMITTELINKSATEYLFFNGKPWEFFLKGKKPILENTISSYDSFIINPGNKVQITAHFGTCLGKKMVWFDKFLNTKGSGTSNKNLIDAGKRIREHYGIK